MENDIPIGCTIMTLPRKLLIPAALAAIEEEPRNRPLVQYMATAISGDESDSIRPEYIAALTGKYFGPQTRVLPTYFMDNPNQATRRLILEHLNLWDCGITFRETANVGDSRIRIGRGRLGHFSYLGMDNFFIPITEITMNLQGFTENTPLSEYLRVVPHEGGHALSFPHEHMLRKIMDRLDREATIRDFMAKQGWSRAEVIAQVFTPLEESQLLVVPGMPLDPEEESSMCYRFEAYLTIDKRPIVGGVRPTARDLAFAQRIYPKADGPVAPGPTTPPASAMAAEINRERSARGLPALVEVIKLDALARAWAGEMASRNRLDHGNSGSRIAAVFPGIPNGEIIAAGQPDESAAVADWRDDPPHAEIMFGRYKGMGSGNATSSRGTRYWVVDFIGAWDDPEPPPPPPPVEPEPGVPALRRGRWSAAARYIPAAGPTRFAIKATPGESIGVEVSGDGNWVADLVPIRPGAAPLTLKTLKVGGSNSVYVGSAGTEADYYLTVRHANARRAGVFKVRYS